jgi:serine/threonine protein kinase
MSNEAKNIIVHLLNRNPSKRLGAGADGADEIKRHPFFEGIDWEAVSMRTIPVPKPRYTLQQYKDQFRNVVCTDEQKRNIFEDYDEIDSVVNKQVDGWSFVGDA